jgi:hypothetical protein
MRARKEAAKINDFRKPGTGKRKMTNEVAE